MLRSTLFTKKTGKKSDRLLLSAGHNGPNFTHLGAKWSETNLIHAVYKGECSAVDAVHPRLRK